MLFAPSILPGDLCLCWVSVLQCEEGENIFVFRSRFWRQDFFDTMNAQKLHLERCYVAHTHSFAHTQQERAAPWPPLRAAPGGPVEPSDRRDHHRRRRAGSSMPGLRALLSCPRIGGTAATAGARRRGRRAALTPRNAHARVVCALRHALLSPPRPAAAFPPLRAASLHAAAAFPASARGDALRGSARDSP